MLSCWTEELPALTLAALYAVFWSKVETCSLRTHSAIHYEVLRLVSERQLASSVQTPVNSDEMGLPVLRAS
jgi:hypothetical protein